MKVRRFVMARRRGVGAVVAAAFVAIAAAPLGAVATSAPEPAPTASPPPLAVETSVPESAPTASSVRNWNLYALNALVPPSDAPEPGAGQTPPVTLLHMAMVHGAIYDAVNAIDGGYQSYLPDLQPASPSASVDAAVATAAHDVLVGLTTDPPLPEAVVTRLDGLYEEALAAIPDGADKTDGIAAGADAAAAMLAARADDGRYVPFSHPVGDQPGEWRPIPPDEVSDPFAWVANVEPFLIDSSSQFRTAGPNPLDSAEYTTEYNEVKDLGGIDAARNPEQQALADFYNVHAVRAVQPHAAHRRRGGRSERRRRSATVRHGQPDRRRHDHHLLGREGVLALLASDHRHPRGRQRRQRRHCRRPDLGADAADAAVSGPRLRLQLRLLGVHVRRGRLLRRGTDRVQRRQDRPRRTRRDPRLRARSPTSSTTPSTPACSRASTSEPPTCRAPRSAPTSPNGSPPTTSSQRARRPRPPPEPTSSPVSCDASELARDWRTPWRRVWWHASASPSESEVAAGVRTLPGARARGFGMAQPRILTTHATCDPTATARQQRSVGRGRSITMGGSHDVQKASPCRRHRRCWDPVTRRHRTRGVGDDPIPVADRFDRCRCRAAVRPAVCGVCPRTATAAFRPWRTDPVATAITASPLLSRLAAAVAATGLDGMLDQGPVTVFAPIDSAFDKLDPATLDSLMADPDALTGVLAYHVIPQQLSGADLVAGGQFVTAGGDDAALTVSMVGETLVINGGEAAVLCADVPTANATVYLIDTVLTPPAPTEAAVETTVAAIETTVPIAATTEPAVATTRTASRASGVDDGAGVGEHRARRRRRADRVRRGSERGLCPGHDQQPVLRQLVGLRSNRADAAGERERRRRQRHLRRVRPRRRSAGGQPDVDLRRVASGWLVRHRAGHGSERRRLHAERLGHRLASPRGRSRPTRLVIGSLPSMPHGASKSFDRGPKLSANDHTVRSIVSYTSQEGPAEPQRIRVGELGLEVEVAAGEELHVEISAKFRPQRIIEELRELGFDTRAHWTDDRGDFGLLLATPAERLGRTRSIWSRRFSTSRPSFRPLRSPTSPESARTGSPTRRRRRQRQV